MCDVHFADGLEAKMRLLNASYAFQKGREIYIGFGLQSQLQKCLKVLVKCKETTNLSLQ